MKYYSEILKRAFDTEKECQEAEATYTEDQKKKKVKLVELKGRMDGAYTKWVRAVQAADDATKVAEDAQKEYYKARDAYNEAAGMKNIDILSVLFGL